MPWGILFLIVLMVAVPAIPLLAIAYSVQTEDERRKKVGRAGFVE